MRVIKKIIDSCASCPFIRGNNPYYCGALVRKDLISENLVLIENRPFHEKCPLQIITVEEVEKMDLFEFTTGR